MLLPFRVWALSCCAFAAKAATNCAQDSCHRSPDAEGEATSLLQARRHNATNETSLFPGYGPDLLGINKVNPDDWLRDCAAELHRLPNISNPANNGYNNYGFYAKPSGLCSASISCQFKQCFWTEEATQAILGNDMSKTSFDDIKLLLPDAILPGHVSFPRSVKDVANAVKTAKQRSWRISVKTSGHSYTGSSTGAGSLLINLRSFPKYSPTSITECADARAGDGTCKLALARGKRAVVRVGGGELWDDTYRAVLAWNSESSHSGRGQYDITGGGVGTVSSIGGWLQGGGLGNGLSRSVGLGVDQVLQLEMVLPCGEHVKFGPARWRRIPGHQYPQTEAVQGLCNVNVHDDERKWRWEQCKSPIPFDRLWRAVRGGGGGTYGVVTAAHYQLHDFQPWYRIMADWEECGWEDWEECRDLRVEFLFNFLYFPASIGVDDNISHGCSSGSGYLLWNWLSKEMLPGLICIGPAADGFIAAWQDFVEKRMPDSEVWRLVAKMLHATTGYHGPMTIFPSLGTPPGHVHDYESGVCDEVSGTWSALVPTQWLLDSKDSNGRWPKNSLAYNFTVYLSRGMGTLHLLGGKVRTSGDGMDAVSRPERSAAMQIGIPTDYRSDYSIFKFLSNGITEASLRKAWLPYSVEKTLHGEVFLGGTEYNHASADVVGPLRRDLVTPCPVGFTAADREQHCLSLQESVWGSELLGELERTKRLVDPDGLLDCAFCVGNSYYPDGKRALGY